MSLRAFIHLCGKFRENLLFAGTVRGDEGSAGSHTKLPGLKEHHFRRIRETINKSVPFG